MKLEECLRPVGGAISDHGKSKMVSFFLLKLERNYELEGNEPLFADWVSKELRIIIEPNFEGLRAGPGGEKIVLVKIKSGIVQESEIFKPGKRVHA